ncbi:hypothetical protein AAZX31_15G170300 [Glycine max]
MGFSYELDVLSWSKTDFSFTYVVPDSSSHISGGVLLESPLIFRKDVVFVIDISGSMQGKLMDDTKNALSVALAKLDPDDSFSIIAFNGEIYHFSKSMELVSKDAVERAIEWINMNFIAGGDTNILYPLNMAIRMLSDAQSSVPIIFLVKDGIVEDERQICDMIKNHMTNAESISPRIYTFGIGSFCNHHFLRMLSMIGRGQHFAALDVDLIEPQMLKLFEKASSLVLANITMGIFNDVDEVEVCPSHIPDLSSDGPLLLSGRYKGSFSKDFEIKGVLPVFSNFVIDMKIQDAKDIPVQRVIFFAPPCLFTIQVAKLSLQNDFISDHPQSGAKEQGQRIILLPPLGIGFGNLTATTENIQPGSEETKGPDGVEIFVKASINCCGTCCNNFCCMCCIQVCTQINNQCAIAFTQLCVGLGCFICLNCCADICCSGNEN